MNRPPLCKTPSLALAVVLLALLPACNDDDSSPTEPPEMGGPMITALSGARVPLTGTWRSRCFTAPPGSPVASIQESFGITDLEIAITVAGFLTGDCTGVTISEELTVDYMLGAETTATLGDQSVPVTRVDGTVRETSDDFQQILHVDDSGVHRLYHGEFDGATDAAGYPTELFEEFLERQ